MMTVIVAGIIAACTPCVVREAQTVVAEADSLRAEGQMYSDSVQLAEACATLGRWQWFYADDYAHACYHYGRLLREKGDPVTAMQVFLSAAHSRTHDFHILGRVYSNMGDLAHWGREYSLSFDMFKSAADLFLSTGDTISYYYCLNDMAFEKAMISDTATVFSLLSFIEHNCTDEQVLIKTQETKAEAYMRAKEYNSALNYASALYQQDGTSQLGLVLLSQIYSYLSLKDSAVYYAKQVLLVSSDYADIQNALYILTNDDDQKDANEIREIAADRADAQKQIEIRQGKFSQAVQLLEQDIKRPLNLSWLYAIMATLIIIGTVIGIYVHIKRQKHTLLSQTLEDLQCATSSVQEKHDELAERYKKNHQLIEDEINNNCRLLQKDEHLSATLKWSDFKEMCRQTDKLFYMFASKLQQKRVLNETEIRLCVLVLINLSRAEISKTLPYALNSIGKLKDHTAKLLGTTGKNLHDFLLKLVIEE